MPYSRHLPKILTEENILDIFEFIEKDPDYPPTEKGEFLKERNKTAISLMFYCGLRPSETIQLKWQDINFEEDLIYTRPYINKIKNDLPAILTKPAKKILFKYKEKFNKTYPKSKE